MTTQFADNDKNINMSIPPDHDGFKVVDIHGFNVILGLDWLEKYNPLIDWRGRTFILPMAPGGWEPKNAISLRVEMVSR